MAYLDELVRGIGIGIATDKRGREVGSSTVMATSVGVEALEREVLLHPGRIFEGVGLEKGNNVVFDGYVFAASDGQMLEDIYARREDGANERYAGDGGVA